VTLLARGVAALGELADSVATGGAVIDTLAADAGDLDGEVAPEVVGFEVAVPRLRLAEW
jgi:hypothetical protein